jgi:hypothetical protein
LPSSKKLDVCRICHCGLEAKVWLTLPTLRNNMPQEQLDRLPSHCWLNTENTAP